MQIQAWSIASFGVLLVSGAKCRVRVHSEVHLLRLLFTAAEDTIDARIKLMLSLLLCLPVNDDCSALRLDILYICCDVLRSEVTVCAELHIKSEP